jgi:flagellar basal-body rod protein FlgB
VGGFGDTTMVVLKDALLGASTRHTALANNLANANTPGYKRVDIDFKATLRDAVAAATNDPSALTDIAFAPDLDTTAGALRADGNTVDVDREMAQLAQNTLEYSTIAAVLKTRLRSIEAAIGVR